MRYFFVLLFIFTAINSRAQDRRLSEFEVWTSLQLQWKINKKWKLKIKNQERFIFEKKPLQLAFAQGEISRKIYKYHTAFFRYRYSFESNEEHSINRFSIGYKFRMKVFKRVRMYDRLIYQYEQRFYTKEANALFRNKIGIQYNLKKKGELDLSYEIFLRQKDVWEIKDHRMTLNYAKQWKKYFTTNIFYRIDFSTNRKQNTNQHILGVALSFSI